MTTADTQAPAWTPKGHPVRNFVVACVVLALLGLAVWWLGLLAPRVDYGFGPLSEGAVTLEIENRSPLPMRIVEATFEDDDPVTVDEQLDSGERATVLVPYDELVCSMLGLGPNVRMRLRTPLGVERTETVNVAFALRDVCAGR